ncbi:MAG: hypothetical protein M3P22_02020 [bacterium]|nr:hypothetical protein [bacterium]
MKNINFKNILVGVGITSLIAVSLFLAYGIFQNGDNITASLMGAKNESDIGISDIKINFMGTPPNPDPSPTPRIILTKEIEPNHSDDTFGIKVFKTDFPNNSSYTCIIGDNDQIYPPHISCGGGLIAGRKHTITEVKTTDLKGLSNYDTKYRCEVSVPSTQTTRRVIEGLGTTLDIIPQKDEEISCIFTNTCLTAGFRLIKKWSVEDFPIDLTFSKGNIFVLMGSSVRKYKPDGSYIEWGKYGTGDGEFISAQGLASDTDGNIYVAEIGNNRVQKFDNNGNYITKWGTSGTKDGQFISITDLEINVKNEVYVADSSNPIGRVQKFSSIDGIKYNFISKINYPFGFPNAMAFDQNGSIYIGDSESYQMLKFDNNGNYITKWGTRGRGENQFEFFGGVAISSSGNVFVSDFENYRIQEFSSIDGITYKQINEWGKYGAGDGEFKNLADIVFDDKGNLYVADNGNNRIQEFALTCKP